MTPEYINTNIRYIEPVYERRMEQVFEVGDVVMVGPQYLSTEVFGVDRYGGDEITGQVVVIEENERNISPFFVSDPFLYQVYPIVDGKEKEFCLTASRLILIRSEGTT